jgi:hypothetical protein
MLIVGIAWIYVVLMMAVVEKSIVAGLMTFIFYGVLPLSIVLYIMGGPARWRKMRAKDRERLPSQEEAKPATPTTPPPPDGP